MRNGADVLLKSLFLLVGGNYGLTAFAVVLLGIGLYLVALAYIAVGNFTSALTSNQIIAAVSSLVILLLLFVISWPADGAGETAKAVLKYLSVTEHFATMIRGIIDTKDLVYFASLTVVFLFLTHRAVESARWK